MSQGVKIKIRNIKELQDPNVASPQNSITPLKKRKKLKSGTAIKNLKEDDDDDNRRNKHNTITKTATKRLIKSALKQTSPNQKRIDSYFTSCAKTYEIRLPKEETPFVKAKTCKTEGKRSRNTAANKRNKQSSRRPKARPKRLFTDSTEPSAENMSVTSVTKTNKNENSVECIILVDDSEEETDVKKESRSSKYTNSEKTAAAASASNSNDNQILIPNADKVPSAISSPLGSNQQLSKTSCEITNSIAKSSVSGSVRRKPKTCPSYKIIENSTFAVDAFQFGYIDNVTHYFLTHFHADHYIGLTKSFSMPLFVSPITARLLRAFIPVQETYIHEIEPNETVQINNIEITALDANHCPGSIMFVFKFLDTDKCILHTGDFRACPDMESEPIFWNNHIHTIYLDTTYISNKYVFCTQYESIKKAQNFIEKYREKNCWHRVLYICGAYIIGKEKFWSSLAEEFNLKVWAEGNRSKALKALDDERLNRLLVEDPKEAAMHILPMGKLTYMELVEYFKQYEHQYDALFALRPSGWEKDTKPRYSSKINVVGIEYSEHSSYAEMQRFVKFLKPDQVISTVPSGKSLEKTSNVPQNWYKYDELKSTSNYQPSIDSYLCKTPQYNKTCIPVAEAVGVEHFVSPLKLCTSKTNNLHKNVTQAHELLSETSSEAAKENENIEAVCTNVQNAKSITISSEEFEKTDFTVKRRKNFKVKNNKTVSTNPKRNKKSRAQEGKRRTTDETSNQTSGTTSNLQNGICQVDKSLDNFNNPTTQSRITRSNKSSNTKTNQGSESSKVKLKKPSKTKSISSASNDGIAEIEQPLPVSQKRITRSTVTSSKTNALLNTSKNKENVYEVKLHQMAEETSTPSSSSPKSQINMHENQLNPILKSTSSASVDRLAHYELSFNKLNSARISDNRNLLDDFENLPAKPNKTKKHALNYDLTPFKKCKTTYDTQTILNNILEQGADLDCLDRSQVAGLVVETLNQQNPVDNNDHIPADLLSDADDDWM